MGKQSSNKGFTLAETLIVLIVFAMLILMYGHLAKRDFDKPIQFVVNDIVIHQFKAIIEDEQIEYENNQHYLYFNRKGSPNQANTFDFGSDEVIVSLGTGRVYVRE